MAVSRARGVAWALLLFLPGGDAFAVEKPKQLGVLDSVKNAFENLLPSQSTQDAGGELQQRREKLKTMLLDECEKGAQRKRVEEVIAELAPLTPISATARSKLLQKNWLLKWTTEKEINFFIDWKLSDDITQKIDGQFLGNKIAFTRGGFLGVEGELAVPDDGGARTNFKFTRAKLDLAKWGSFDVPPIGEGWFDTIYLDEDLRVDTNSRDDILICTPI